MKLYDLKRGEKFRVVDATGVTPEVYQFHHLDGMYSFCKDKDDNTVHFMAWADVERVEK